jgi:hypothetical protein
MVSLTYTLIFSSSVLFTFTGPPLNPYYSCIFQGGSIDKAKRRAAEAGYICLVPAPVSF